MSYRCWPCDDNIRVKNITTSGNNGTAEGRTRKRPLAFSLQSPKYPNHDVDIGALCKLRWQEILRILVVLN